MTIQVPPDASPHAREHSTPDPGDFFSREEWRNLISQVYGFRSAMLASRDDAGNVVAALPLALVRAPLGGRHLTAFPFSDSCPLPADRAAATDLIEQALALNACMRSRYLELRTGANDLLAQRSDFVASNRYAQWTVSLTGGPDAAWKNVKKSVQRQIEKATHAGLGVTFADSRDAMRRYHHLHLLSRTRTLGMPAQPLRYFNALWGSFAGDGTLQLLFAEHEGAVIAGMVVLAHGGVARYAGSASDERYLHLAPHNLLLWTAMRWASEHGYATFDLGRTARDNDDLMERQRGWGATEQPLTYYYAPASAANRARLAAMPEHSRTYRLATSCWKRLPLALAGPLGGALYRHLG
jgi:CelD/BcsL family acetyltransferase involved in cellulose biosynthesis